jgi:hypothetical protein
MENREKEKTSAEFSQKPEGGKMRNRDDKGMTNIDRSSGSEVNETSRRPGSSYDSSTGRSDWSGDKNSGSDRLRDDRLRDEDDSKHSDNSGSMGAPPKDRHF